MKKEQSRERRLIRVDSTALVDLMVEIKGYIERAEENVDYEWGGGRTLEGIINDGDMPPLYFKVVDFIERSTVKVSHRSLPNDHED